MTLSLSLCSRIFVCVFVPFFSLSIFEVSSSPKEVQYVFLGCLKVVSRKFQECFKEVPRVFQRSLKEISRVFKKVLRAFQLRLRVFF